MKAADDVVTSIEYIGCFDPVAICHMERNNSQHAVDLCMKFHLPYMCLSPFVDSDSEQSSLLLLA